MRRRIVKSAEGSGKQALQLPDIGAHSDNIST